MSEEQKRDGIMSILGSGTIAEISKLENSLISNEPVTMQQLQKAKKMCEKSLENISNQITSKEYIFKNALGDKIFDYSNSVINSSGQEEKQNIKNSIEYIEKQIK